MMCYKDGAYDLAEARVDDHIWGQVALQDVSDVIYDYWRYTRPISRRWDIENIIRTLEISSQSDLSSTHPLSPCSPSYCR